MTFSQLEYKRVDIGQVAAQLEELTGQLLSAADFGQADRVFREKDALLTISLDSMRTIAQIRHDIDTRNSFYEEESDFYDFELPKLKPAEQNWTRALLASPFRPQFEEKYGPVPFLNAELEERSFSPALVEDLQQENELVSRYNKLIASAQIPFEGQVLTLSQLTPYKLSPDDSLRRRAWQAEGEWFNSRGEELDQIYDGLVELRHRMGQKLGHPNFIPLGYDRMGRNCYREEDVEAFRAAVRKHLVPLADRLCRSQAQRLGFDYPLSFADKDLVFRSGNPRPVGDPQEILNTGGAFYTALSPETAEFWAFMREGEMMDVESRPGKCAGGYCTTIASVPSPFIFANFNGTAGDVEVITHEAGHAFADYLNRYRVPADTRSPSLEGCEVHSMSMEFFAEDRAEDFFGPDARKFRYSHLADALIFIPYGTMVDHFQHEVYRNPQYTPAQRHRLWQDLSAVYMPWVKMQADPFYGQGRGWQRQLHIYCIPFYYIDYCLAQAVALQFWLRIRRNRQQAFQTYMDYTRMGGSQVFTRLLAQAGLDSPFDEDCLRDICREAEDFLNSYDLTGIE